METLKQRLLEHIADLLDEPMFDMAMRLRDCIDPLPNDKSELHLLMTDAAFKVFCNYFGKEDTTEQCAINGVIESAFIEIFDKAACIQHWHNTGKNDEGMVVSSEKVHELWEVLEKYRDFRHSL